MQLISQELQHIPKDEFEEHLSNKNYLDEFQDYNNDSISTDSIYTWEYVMSRFFSSDINRSKNINFSKSEERLYNATDKSNFIFKLSNGLKYSRLPKEKYTTIDNAFFRDSIYLLYGKRRPYESIRKQVGRYIKGLGNLPKLLRYTFFEKSFVGYQEIVTEVDQSFITNGWSYIKKITQLAFLMITGLYIYFISTIVKSYEFVYSYSEVTIISLYIPVIFMTGGLIYLFWIGRYLARLPQIISGEGSIEYFCWTFFIFRVQFLNSKGIIPLYFSRAFLRYFKNELIDSKFENIKNAILESAEECCICSSDNYNLAPDQVDSMRICNPHLDSYKEMKYRINDFSDDQFLTHQIVKRKAYYDETLDNRVE